MERPLLFLTITMPILTLKDGVQIHYQDAGKGDPVLLIHGWPLSSGMWEYQSLALLEAGFRVITYDRRGFGRSSHPDTGYDYDTLANDLRELILHLELRNITLVGFSMGGGEVARYLSKFSGERVSKAVLISSVLPSLSQSTRNPEGIPLEKFEERIVEIKTDRPAFLAKFAQTFYGVGAIKERVSEEILNWTASYLAYPASPLATIECIHSFPKTDFTGDIASFTLPTLIIHGTEDKNTPIAATAERLLPLIPHSVFKRYPDAAHGLFITHREELNSDLIAFLKQEMGGKPETPRLPGLSQGQPGHRDSQERISLNRKSSQAV